MMIDKTITYIVQLILLDYIQSSFLRSSFSIIQEER